MREICEITVVDTSPGVPDSELNKVVGRFVLDNNKLTYELAPGGTDLLFKRMLAEDITVNVDGELLEINSAAEPNLWFAALPYHYSNATYMSARIVSRTGT